MKFLCLHGSGTSGEILRAQTAALRGRLLSGEHSFDFVDGPCPSKAGPGVEPFFDPPFFSFWETVGSAQIKESTQWILKRLRAAQPPYDACLGFSQGCGVISALIMHHQLDYPGEPLPFRGAFFICGGAPIMAFDNWFEIPTKARELSDKTMRALTEASESVAKRFQALLDSPTPERMEIWDKPTMLTDDNGKPYEVSNPWELPPVDPKDVFGLDVTSLPPHMYIHIPTVHVYGRKDPRSPSSVQLAMMCDKDKRRTYDHGGGHEIPRKSQTSDDLIRAIDWLEKEIQK